MVVVVVLKRQSDLTWFFLFQYQDHVGHRDDELKALEKEKGKISKLKLQEKKLKGDVAGQKAFQKSATNPTQSNPIQ